MRACADLEITTAATAAAAATIRRSKQAQSSQLIGTWEPLGMCMRDFVYTVHEYALYDARMQLVNIYGIHKLDTACTVRSCHASEH